MVKKPETSIYFLLAIPIHGSPFIKLYLGSIGMNHVKSELCYLETILLGIIGKCPFHGHFPISP